MSSNIYPYKKHSEIEFLLFQKHNQIHRNPDIHRLANLHKILLMEWKQEYIFLGISRQNFHKVSLHSNHRMIPRYYIPNHLCLCRCVFEALFWLVDSSLGWKKVLLHLINRVYAKLRHYTNVLCKKKYQNSSEFDEFWCFFAQQLVSERTKLLLYK